MNGIGASFRQADTGTSLHVAFNRVSCDVHVDRNGFVVRGPDGKVTWDLNGLLRHLTVDLAGDKVPWFMVSAGWVDDDNRPIIQAPSICHRARTTARRRSRSGSCWAAVSKRTRSSKRSGAERQFHATLVVDPAAWFPSVR
jgi:hypothetical protein